MSSILKKELAFPGGVQKEGCEQTLANTDALSMSWEPWLACGSEIFLLAPRALMICWVPGIAICVAEICEDIKDLAALYAT